jgi:lactate dehydrogenase-like 2-hydroxyacid dehydrogenase
MLVILFWTNIDDAFLAAHPRLRFVATRSSGYDHIDLGASRGQGVVVCSVPSYGENTVAEHTFALILTLTRRLREVATAERKGRFSFEELRGFDLHGKTLGVIGTGRIGLHVIRLARAFGMEVVAFDSHPSDVIANLHAEPVSPEERHQRDPQRLEELRTLGRNEALLARSDVVFTPHVAFNGVEAVERIDQVTIENIRTFVAGTPINTITGYSTSDYLAPGSELRKSTASVAITRAPTTSALSSTKNSGLWFGAAFAGS